MLSRLLEAIEPRGRDATGISWWATDSNSNKPWPMMVKAPVTATHFVDANRDYIREAANSNLVIAHTRFPTQGSKEHNENNHPIDHGLIVGVHNGSVYNDYEIFKDLGPDIKRNGEVDSEAIFAVLSVAAIAHDPGEIRVNAMAKALEKIQGSMAIAFYVKDEPGVLYLARGASSPLLVSASSAGDVVFASTADAIHDATEHMPVKSTFTSPQWIDEGTFMRFENGAMTHEVTFVDNPPPKKSTYYYTHTWNEPTYAPVRSTNLSFPHNVLDQKVFSQSPAWIDTPMSDAEFARLDGSISAWDLLSDHDLSYWVGMYSATDQQELLHDALPNAFLYPPVSTDRIDNSAGAQDFRRCAISRFTERLLDPRDRRSTEALRNETYRNLGTIITYDRVRCKVGNNWRDGWFVAHSHTGSYPSSRIIVAIPENNDVTLRMISQWNVKPYNERPDDDHIKRLDYIEDLAIEHAYCVKHEKPIVWPYLDFVTYPTSMFTRTTQMELI